MPHYVVIEPESGFVWEEAAADCPEAACRIIDEKLGDTREWYRDVGKSQHEIHNSYFVYEAPADWEPVTDGQDPSEIERVEKLPFAARVKYAARTW